MFTYMSETKGGFMETYNVYSSMLGGYLAMGFKTKKEAQSYIENYHCKIEKARMSVITKGVIC